MRRVGNLYHRITDIKNIKYIYDKKVRLNTKNKVAIERFDEYYASNIARIKYILDNKLYKPGKYNIFLIKEPKVRLIMSQCITDKIINHLVSIYILESVFDRLLIDNNIATRVGKGTHYGINKLKTYLNIHINEDLYILKYDIKKYFFNISHQLLKKIIRDNIKDNDAINIIDTIIDSTDDSYINEKINEIKKKEINKIKLSNNKDKDRLIKEINDIPLCKRGYSLSLGCVSSQIFAIVFMYKIDNYIKRVLKPGIYIRYMDDGILVSNDKEFLKYCLSEIKKLMNVYELELNSKTRIYSIDDGFDFLGFRFVRRNGKLSVRVKNQTKRRFKRKMKNLYKLYSGEMVTLDIVNQVKYSYLGHLRYGNTDSLIDNTLNRYFKDKYDIGNYVAIDDYGNIIISN